SSTTAANLRILWATLEWTCALVSLASSWGSRYRSLPRLWPATRPLRRTNGVVFKSHWEASSNGSSVLKSSHSLKGTIPPESLAKLKQDGVYYKDSIKLPPGKYQVKFVARNNLNGSIGSVTTMVTVR
ncbi:MAG TPA: hypothetical protein VMD76_03780, partial [Candidatus Sulfotelmatobacter sp.]|nr:hypothetical protein [Candidatus Sulfotelmatobacter sp.]